MCVKNQWISQAYKQTIRSQRQRNMEQHWEIIWGRVLLRGGMEQRRALAGRYTSTQATQQQSWIATAHWMIIKLKKDIIEIFFSILFEETVNFLQHPLIFNPQIPDYNKPPISKTLSVLQCISRSQWHPMTIKSVILYRNIKCLHPSLPPLKKIISELSFKSWIHSPSLQRASIIH